MFSENEFLIKKNPYKNINGKMIEFNNGVAKIKIGNNVFDGSVIRNILEQLNYILKFYGKKCKAIQFDFKTFEPKDKMTYIIFEIIIYSLIKKYGKYINMRTEKICFHINTEGFCESILYAWLCKKIPYEKYTEIFERKNRIERNSYRRIIKADDISAVSDLMGDTKTFLKGFDINDEDMKRISRIVSELADNACEHGNCDCLVDVDVEEDYTKDGDETGDYYSVNICVLNFSDILLGEKVKKKILSKQFHDAAIYKGIENAYIKHKQMFDDRYTEDHFFMLASFQDKISGRCEETNTGGRGLAEIVKELEQSVDEYECYVISGSKGIFFYPENLDVDGNGWISFNRKKDFVNFQPEHNVVTYSDTDLGGTGYNLSLIYRRSKNE